MKILDRIALTIFSIIMLLISILILVIIFGWLDLTTIYVLVTKFLADSAMVKTLIAVNCIFILLAIKGIFFESGSLEKENYGDGILLENEDGKLVITKETLISMVNAVVSGFESVKTSQTKVYLDEENNLSIVLTIETTQNTIIKDLSNNLQIRIKEKIKESLDLEVKSIDIRVKNIVETKDNVTSNV